MFDPAIGRWISEDPIEFDAGDENLVRYVGNDPVGKSDLSGLFEISGVGDGPIMSLDPDAYRGAGAYASVWINLDDGEIKALKQDLPAQGDQRGGYLIETNHVKYQVSDYDSGKIRSNDDKRLWFLMFYIMNGKELVSQQSQRDEGNLSQYKALLDFRFGSNGLDLETFKNSKGFITVESTFELYKRGTTVAHRKRFQHQKDWAVRPRVDDSLGEPVIVPGMTIGDYVSRFRGDFIDEVGLISKHFPWRMGAARKPISRKTVEVTFEWEWCEGEEPKIKVIAPDLESGGPDRGKFSGKLGDAPDWDL